MHEAKGFEELLCDLDCLTEFCSPRYICGDKAYSSNKIREDILSLGVTPVIPTKCNEESDENFEKEVYRRRNIVERCIGWLKEFRRIATRYEKLASRFLAMFRLAAIVRQLRPEFSDRP